MRGTNTTRRWRRPVGLVIALGLVAAACGGDDDSADTPAPETTAAAPDDTDDTDDSDDADTDDGDEPAPPSGEALPTEGSVEIAAGTVLELDECPSDWDPLTGITDSEIRLGWSGPQSGPLAAFGEIPVGMQAYFDWINENDPVGDRELVLRIRDDAYEAGRAVANVEEMIDTDNIFAFVHTIGTPINVALRPLTDEECVPQLFNSTGFPIWGDPANWPWTSGFILDYIVEGEIWCTTIVEEFGEGATVAALYMNNDFGRNYETAMNNCAADGRIEIIVEELHDQAAPDVSNEMTTMIASGADVFVAGTTAAFCPQTVAAVAASEWRPQFYMSYTCNNLASFFTPVIEQAEILAEAGSGVRMVNSNKTCGDPVWDADPAIQLSRQILRDYADLECEDGSFSTGILYGEIVVEILRAADALPGGINRVNLMAAVWNADVTSDYLLTGQYRTDGVNDAYFIESGQVQEVIVSDGALAFSGVSDPVDFEGAGGSVGN